MLRDLWNNVFWLTGSPMSTLTFREWTDRLLNQDMEYWKGQTDMMVKIT